MSQGQAPEIEIEARESAADEFEAWLRGGEGEGTPTERFSDLQFTELKQKAVQAGAALKQSAFSIPDALKATFYAAMYRDMKYAYATRGELLELGANNALRESYEGVRAANDSGL